MQERTLRDPLGSKGQKPPVYLKARQILNMIHEITRSQNV